MDPEAEYIKREHDMKYEWVLTLKCKAIKLINGSLHSRKAKKTNCITVIAV